MRLSECSDGYELNTNVFGDYAPFFGFRIKSKYASVGLDSNRGWANRDSQLKVGINSFM